MNSLGLKFVTMIGVYNSCHIKEHKTHKRTSRCLVGIPLAGQDNRTTLPPDGSSSSGVGDDGIALGPFEVFALAPPLP